MINHFHIFFKSDTPLNIMSKYIIHSNVQLIYVSNEKFASSSKQSISFKSSNKNKSLEPLWYDVFACNAGVPKSTSNRCFCLLILSGFDLWMPILCVFEWILCGSDANRLRNRGDCGTFCKSAMLRLMPIPGGVRDERNDIEERGDILSGGVCTEMFGWWICEESDVETLSLSQSSSKSSRLSTVTSVSTLWDFFA